MHALAMPATFEAERPVEQLPQAEPGAQQRWRQKLGEGQLFDTEEARSQDRESEDRWARFQSAMSVLRARLHGNGASDLVLAELVEDDLRQARVALHAIESFLDGAVDALGDPQSCAADVVNAGDPHEALEAAERLENALPGLRRRMGQVALRFARR